jgi:hypothetical protein
MVTTSAIRLCGCRDLYASQGILVNNINPPLWTQLSRIFSVAAIFLFFLYLYAPCEVSFITTDKEPKVSTGLDEVVDAFRLAALPDVITPLLSARHSPERWDGMRALWDDASREIVLLMACIAISQLPFLSLRRIPVPRRWQRIVSALFLMCAGSLLYGRFDFIELQNPSHRVYSRPGYLSFGAWLSPTSFVFAGVATLLRGVGASRKPARESDACCEYADR